MEDGMGKHHMQFSRRGFLSASLSGLAAVGLAGAAPRIALAQEGKKETAAPGKKLITRTLGRTGMELPIVSMGVGACNDPSVIAAAYEAGVRHYDTAANYQFGRNEQLVGQVFSRLNVRDKVNIGTKEWTPGQRAGLTAQQARDKFIKLTEGSLRRLKTAYIDIVYIHSTSSAADLQDDAAKEAFTQLKKDGKVRAAGVTTHAGMTEVINEAARDGFYDVVLTSWNVSMADDNALAEAVKNAAAKGIGLIAMKTQAGGAQLPNRAALGQYSSSVINTASLKWAMSNKHFTTSIPGFTSLEHLHEDFPVAADLTLTAEEQKFLADNNLKLGLNFCRQCRQCLASCPHNTDVPTLMRTHMYAAQYSDFYLARTTLDGIPQGKGLKNCSSCSSCVVNCANRVNVRAKIEDLKLMYA
jgi:predicted aldo/keto reductase-like oxidoreductase